MEISAAQNPFLTYTVAGGVYIKLKVDQGGVMPNLVWISQFLASLEIEISKTEVSSQE